MHLSQATLAEAGLTLRLMATYQIIAWKDVPAMVEARDAAETITRP